MNKKYEIRLPVIAYSQPIGLSIMLLFHLSLLFRLENLPVISLILYGFGIVFLVAVIIIQLILNRGFSAEIEITEHGIKTNKIELPIDEIDKIIIQGYFIQSIGIKQIGKRFVTTKLHFRFKHDNELQIREWEQWGEKNGIKIAKGTIYKWI